VATFLFIHGAFHGASSWSKLILAMEARGHRGVAIDLPSLGDDTTPLKDVTLDLWIDRVAGGLRSEAEPVVLVGHSLGGIVIAGAAERMPERVRLLVYLAAFLPRDGDSILSLSASPAARKETGPSAFARSEDGIGLVAKPEAAPGRFYGQCSEADVAYAVPRLRPLAYAVQKTAVRLTPERYGRIPRAFIECLDDNAVSLGLQRDMVRKAGCDRVLSLPTDHSPFFSAPNLLADALVGLLGEARS
jgi:pimeloyl-ACP methyl ester carboxylesterase